MMVNTGELQTHLLATNKGKNFHKMRQQLGKPLENPFIGFVFSDESGKNDIHIHSGPISGMYSNHHHSNG